jgi:hypothetical protein
MNGHKVRFQGFAQLKGIPQGGGRIIGIIGGVKDGFHDILFKFTTKVKGRFQGINDLGHP